MVVMVGMVGLVGMVVIVGMVGRVDMGDMVGMVGRMGMVGMVDMVRIAGIAGIVGRRRRRRVKLGLCASLLALSSSTDWVSCNEEVTDARAQYSFIKMNPASSATLLTLDAFCGIGIILHCSSLNKQSR